ncbi:carbohydrate ABC transporter permease [uncultured Alsobacter sp.]|uniref:carbohydrate ABC transporter permease n=1 Tax=uncultured Alsobacter sp. TaxID=1748258 RepID=UPI0025E9DF98|nr:carbohydrate ABC transporter permease [uncultured Alsobacter sp.]
MSDTAISKPATFVGMRLIALVIAVVVLGPIAWGVATSLKTEVMAVRLPPTFIPSPLTFENYDHVFRYQGFLGELWNSTFYAVGAVILALIVAIPAGYAASRFDFPAKKPIMLVILATSMVPGVAVLVPTYYVLDALGLLNNRLVIVVLLAARIAPQTVWFLQNFIDAVPVEIEESASIDGATRFQILRLLVLPLIKPGIAAIAVIGVVTIWNDYITVAVFAPDVTKRTLQVALVNQVFDTVGISWSYMMAFAMTASLPVMILFAIVQKWFVAGLTAGAVKG